MSTNNEELARIAYQAYGEKAGWKNYAGLPMPQWSELGDAIQASWMAALSAAVDHLAATPPRFVAATEPMLIGPLTADEWCEFRMRRSDEAELLQCCAETSNVRDHIFHLLRMGPEDELMRKHNASSFLRHVYWPLESHGIEGRGAELLKKMHDYYVPASEPGKAA